LNSGITRRVHMIYLNVDALKQLKTDLAGFYARAEAGSR
jgi:hypothetical protein